MGSLVYRMQPKLLKKTTNLNRSNASQCRRPFLCGWHHLVNTIKAVFVSLDCEDLTLYLFPL